MGDKKQLLFLQGAGAGAHDDWDDKLVASLGRALGPRYAILYPRLPNEEDPSAEAWTAAIARALASLGPGALVVGHSIGAALLLETLATISPAPDLGGLFLVAPPFTGEGGWPRAAPGPPPDLAAALPDDLPIHFYFGLDDETVPAAHADLFARALPRAHIRRLPGRDHQLGNDLREIAADIVSARRSDRAPDRPG